MKKVFTCEEGDIVLWNGKKVMVAVVISKGMEDQIVRQKVKVRGKVKVVKRMRFGERADISINRIMGNGQVLKRTSIPIDQNWVHV